MPPKRTDCVVVGVGVAVRDVAYSPLDLPDRAPIADVFNVDTRQSGLLVQEKLFGNPDTSPY